MHSIVWFWTTGIHDPAWVQAVAAVALVVLTIITLVVLAIYARDTHTLARMSVEQITLARKEHTFNFLRNSQAAYDCIFKANDDVINIAQSVADGTFGTKPQLPIYPQNWPDATSALIQRKSDMTEPMISFGVYLRAVDLAVDAFFGASDDDDKRDRKKAVHKAVADAARDCKSLIEALKTIGKQ